MRQNPHRNPRPIFSRADYCDMLLDEISRLPLKETDRRRSEAVHIRLVQWINSLNVWADTGPNLDSLLDPSKKHIRIVIEHFLTNVEGNLVQIVRLASSKTASTFPENYFDPEFTVIESWLTKLRRFANLLLLHTKAGLGCRVARYQRTHEDRGLKDGVIQHLWTHFPYLRPKLIQEELPRWETLGLRCFKPDEAMLERVKAPGDEPAGLFKVLVDAVLFTHYKTLYSTDSEQRRIHADPEITHWTLPFEETATSPTEHQRSCPICGEACSESSLQQGEDVCHFLHTAKPYVCLHSCHENNPPSFETDQQWHTHMQSRHGEWWVRRLPKNVRWVCHTCNGVSPVEFESRELMARNLVDHQHRHHGEEDNKRALTLARLNFMSCPRSPVICPICGNDYGVSPEQPTSRLGKDEPSTSSSKEDEDGPLDLRDWEEDKRVHECIAKHLFELSLRFKYPKLNLPGDRRQTSHDSLPWALSSTSIISDVGISEDTDTRAGMQSVDES